jgi:20S proteasome alpha/beta subunit
MTLLVGILCEDGIVVASDGMMSRNLGVTPFVGISNIKTHIIDSQLIVACAGDDNLMTQFVNFLRYNPHSCDLH